jgi:serine/threonine-protein kinase
MRFIRGDSLKEAIEHFHADDMRKKDPGRRSLELRKLLRRLTDVCNAIDYAHSRGILHRDIKPGNIIVGKHGETLVIDWGLAKATGQAEPGAEERTMVPSASSGSSETLPGSALGTPAFMSPEQAAGDLEHLGPQSDVYSLGATLYSLLTGRPPVEGNDVGELLQKVRRGEFTPPRQHDATIDPALEAVSRKAMALKPEDRYATPRLLAEDIERWMADEPVSAYREPWTRTLARWLSRHRTGVTGVAAAILVALIGTAAVLAVQSAANARLSASLHRESTANAALATSNAELTHSKAAVQARYELAVEAIKTFHTGVSEDFLLKEEQFKELRDRLLKSASDFYGKLGALLGKETDPASRRALAQAEYEVADLTNTVGRKEAALAAYRRVLAAQEDLAADPRAGAEPKADVGRSLTAIASLLEGIGKTDEAVATYRKADGLLAAATGPAPASPVRAALADCRSRLGYLLYTTGHASDGLLVLRQAQSDQEVLAEADGAAKETRRDLANTINRIGNLLLRTGRPAEADVHFRRAMAIYQKLADDNPDVTEFRLRLAFAHNNLGGLLQVTGKLSESEAEFRHAMTLRQKLADDNPAVTEFRNGLALGHRNLGKVLWDRGRPAEAEAEYHKAIAIYQKLADDNVAVTEFRIGLADCHNSLALLLYQTGRWTESEAEFREAMAVRQKLANDDPTLAEIQNDLAQSHHNLGYLLSDTGQPAEAETEYRKSLVIYQELADDNPGVTRFRDSLANGHLDLGILLLQTGQPEEAEVEQRKAVALYQKLLDDNPEVPNHRYGLAGALYYLGDVIRPRGRAAEARDAYERAIAIHERLAQGSPNPWYRSLLAHSLRRRGLALRDLGDPARAAADARRALGLFDGLPSRSGEEWFETACCHAALASLAGHDGAGVSAAAREEETDRTMGLLRRAAAMGYRNANAFRTESALAPLHDRPDFRALMMDLAFPADPFAKGR